MKYIKLFAGLQQNCLPFIILFTLCFCFFFFMKPSDYYMKHRGTDRKVCYKENTHLKTKWCIVQLVVHKKNNGASTLVWSWQHSLI